MSLFGLFMASCIMAVPVVLGLLALLFLFVIRWHLAAAVMFLLEGAVKGANIAIDSIQMSPEDVRKLARVGMAAVVAIAVTPALLAAAQSSHLEVNGCSAAEEASAHWNGKTLSFTSDDYGPMVVNLQEVSPRKAFKEMPQGSFGGTVSAELRTENDTILVPYQADVVGMYVNCRAAPVGRLTSVELKVKAKADNLSVNAKGYVTRVQRS